MRFSFLLRNLKHITEGKIWLIVCKKKRIEYLFEILLERIPKKKPYWLTKSNLEIPKQSRAVVDVIQTYKARTNEPGFLKRTILMRNYQKRNEYVTSFVRHWLLVNISIYRFSEKDFFEQGPDVYAAARTIEYDGRFRMNGRQKWITKLEKPKGTLALNLNFQLEAVDLSQTTINIDGLDHYGR